MSVDSRGERRFQRGESQKKRYGSSISPQSEFSTTDGVEVVAAEVRATRPELVFVTLQNPAGARIRLPIRADVAFRHGARVGSQFSASDAAVLLDAASEARAQELAMGALARRGRSVREMQRWLATKGATQRQSAAVIDRLSSAGLLDDAKFAESFVRARVLGRGASIWRLRSELARRGIARDIADRAIAAVTEETGTDELGIARREAAKKWRALGKVEPPVAKRRLIAYLRRRGFSGAIVSTIVRELARPSSD